MNDLLNAAASLVYNLMGIAMMYYIVRILAQAFKDAKLLNEQPFFKNGWFKLALCVMFIAQLGRMVDSRDTEIYWYAINGSVLCCAALVWRSYKTKYLHLKIEYQDHTGFLHLPDDSYLEVQKGVSLRNYTKGGKQLVPGEKKLIKFSKNFDQSRHLAIFFRIKKGSRFPKHRHPKHEHVFLLTGRAVVIDRKGELGPGEVQTTEPREVHSFHALENCTGVAMLEI